jgi:hypothetical protein
VSFATLDGGLGEASLPALTRLFVGVLPLRFVGAQYTPEKSLLEFGTWELYTGRMCRSHSHFQTVMVLSGFGWGGFFPSGSML